MSSVIAGDSESPLWKTIFENSPEHQDKLPGSHPFPLIFKKYFPLMEFSIGKLRWEGSRQTLIEWTVLAILYGPYKYLLTSNKVWF